MGTRARHQRRQEGLKIERLKQALRRGVAKRALEFVHDQAVAIDGQSLVRHSKTEPLEDTLETGAAL